MIELNENYIGSLCEMSTMSNEIVCIGKLTELPSSDNDFMLSIAATMDRFPVLAHRTHLKVHIRSTKYDSIFLTCTVEVCQANIMRFTNIQFVSQTEKRNAFRVSYRHQSSFYLKGTRSPAGIVLFWDISMGGFMCRSHEQLSQNRLYTVELPIADGTYLFTFRVVRNIPTENDDVYVYGCQFLNITDKQMDTLARFIFALQKESISKLRQYTR